MEVRSEMLLHEFRVREIEGIDSDATHEVHASWSSASSASPGRI
jgi:hypothetical protein